MRLPFPRRNAGVVCGTSSDDPPVMSSKGNTSSALASSAPKRWMILALLLTVLGVVGGCSRAELVYDNADWLIYRWASNLFDATAEQKDAWRGRFAGLLVDHREQLLPRVVDLLGDIESAAQGGLDESALRCLVERTDALYRDHAELIVPVAVGILQELTPRQHEQLAERFSNRNAEYVDEYLDAHLDKRSELRIERYIERAETWLGSLSEAQRLVMAEAIAQMPDTAEPWLAYRRHQQQRLLDLLRTGVSERELTDFLTAWWVELEDRPPALIAAADSVRSQSVALALRIDGSLEPRQRARFINRVADLNADLGNALTLAASGTGPAAPQGCG